MITLRNPAGLASPFSRYSHAAEAGPGSRWLFISGQVGVNAEGVLAQGIEAQMEQVFQNIETILADANMAISNLVKVTALLVNRDDVGIFREVRDRHLSDHPAASTLMIVSGLGHPDWLVEIEGVAAA